MKPSTPRQRNDFVGRDVPSSEEFGTLELEDADFIEGLLEESTNTRRTGKQSNMSQTPFHTPYGSQSPRRRSSELILSQEKESIAIPQNRGRKRPAPEDGEAPTSSKLGRLVDAVPVNHYEPVPSRVSSNTSISTAYITPTRTPTTPPVTGTAETSFESKIGARKSSLDPSDVDHALEMIPPPMVRSASDPTQNNSQGAGSFDVKAYLNKWVKSTTPFRASPEDANGYSFRVRYEVTRVALHTGIPEAVLFQKLKRSNIELDCYGDLWSALASCVDSKGKEKNLQRSKKLSLPERCSENAWAKAKDFSKHVDLSGDLEISKQHGDRLFNLKLKPFKLSRSNRTSRKYGFDRLLFIDIPTIEPKRLPDVLGSHSDEVVKAMIDWLQSREHRLIGRVWVPWYVKPIDKSRANQTADVQSSVQFGSRVYFIALRGMDIKTPEDVGKNDRLELKGIEQFVDWALTLNANKSQPILKLFSRFQLVLSPTHSTLEFSPMQILRRDNAYSDSPGEWRLNVERSHKKKKNPHERPSKPGTNVMNDGCSRMSQKAAEHITKELGLDTTPCAFQGRIAGAKGMWLVAARKESLPGLPFGSWNDNDSKSDPAVWIELTDEQVKFETMRSHRDGNLDPMKLTFEALDYVKPLSVGYLNLQVLSVLLANGVSDKIFKKLLTEDITDKAEKMKAAMKDPSDLAAFLQKQSPVRSQRVAAHGIEMHGGLPINLVERILYLINAGFHPLQNQFLCQLCSKQINLRNRQLIERMSIGIARSTKAFIVPDPMDVLDERECFLHFSSTFEDPKSGEKLVYLHNRDVLVARSPVLQRSDIQKVRAVFKPELESYKDVVIFSCRGKESLANCLSGGDFDGDKVWICWEPDIVANFTNYTGPTQSKTAKDFNMEQRTQILETLLVHPSNDPKSDSKAVKTFLEEGLSLNMRQSLLPAVNTYFDRYVYKYGYNQKSQDLSDLCAILLDASKAGIDYRREHWEKFKEDEALPKLPPPAYKTQDERQLQKSLHPIDALVSTALKLVEKLMEGFKEEFSPGKVEAYDKDLCGLLEAETKSCLFEPALESVLKQLNDELKELSKDWAAKIASMKRGKATETAFRLVANQAREAFLRIRPKAGTSSAMARRWEMECEPGCRLATRGSWTLLKASAFFNMNRVGSAAWWICGQELCRIKADAAGGSVPVVRGLYDLMSVDGKLVERIKLKDRLLEAKDSELEDTMAVDSDDEYGHVDWDMVDVA